MVKGRETAELYTRDAKSLRVILVGGSEEDVLQLSEEIRRRGYEPNYKRVETSGQLEWELGELEGRPGAWHAVLCNYYVSSGFGAPDALSLLQGSGHDLPFIVVGCGIADGPATDVIRMGAHDYVSKQNLARLVPAIEREVKEARIRRRFEAAQREQSRLASFPASNPNPVIETTLAGEVTYLNPAARKLFPDLVESQAEHPMLADLAGVSSRIRNSGDPSLTRETKVDGLWYRESIHPVPQSGPAHLLRIYAIDVSERRRAEETLKASEKRFRALVENATDMIIVLDDQGSILYESPAVERILGYAPEERVGKSVFDLIDPEEAGRIRHELAQFLQSSNESLRLEYRVRDSEDSRRYFEAIGVNRLDDSTVGGIVVNSREITGRKKAEERLNWSHNLLNSIVEGTTEAIVVKDLEGRYLLANAATAEVIGRPAEELLGKSDDELLPAEMAHPLIEVDRRVMESGETITLEEKAPLGNQTRIFSSTKTPYRDHRGEIAGVISVSTDITERKRSEEAMTQIREAERKRMARDLHDGALQDISHAAAEVELVKMVPDEPESQARLGRASESLRRGGRNLRAAVYNLRLGEGDNRPLSRLLKSLVHQNRGMNPEQEIRLEIREGLSQEPLQESGKELMHLLQEALTNARRHSQASHVLLGSKIEGEELVVEVSDDGKGFGSQTPSGVGLNSMQERAEALGGILEIESAPGEGTIVRVRVPLPRLWEAREDVETR